MPNEEISRWEMGGWPRGLLINSSDELIVIVHCDCLVYIDMYRCEDGERIKEILVDDFLHEQRVLYHVVQLSKGNFIISHMREDSDRVYLSEVSIDGMAVIRTFDHRSIESNELTNWRPFHMTIDEYDNIGICG